MPYKFESDRLHIPRSFDKRIKLSQKERLEIKQLYGFVSQRKLAKQYNVSRRLIQFIGNPIKLQHNLLNRRLNGGSKQYYDKLKNTTYIIV